VSEAMRANAVVSAHKRECRRGGTPPLLFYSIYISFPLSGGLFKQYHHILMKHLREQNLTYFGHLLYAWNIAMRLFLLSLTAVVHGVLPSIWVRSVSDKVREMDADLS